MSYDIGLFINTGIYEYQVHDCGNMTYNVSKMYRETFPAGMDGIHALAEIKAADAIEMLRMVIGEMESNPSKYKLLNPPNGWGNYESALQYIRNILVGCEQHPNCIIRIS